MRRLILALCGFIPSLVMGASDGFFFPNGGHINNTMTGAANFLATIQINAATEKAAFIGDIYVNGEANDMICGPDDDGGGPHSACTIEFRTGAVTWAGGDTIKVGLQDCSTASGVPLQPDGTFDTGFTLTQGVDTVSANTWHTVTMDTDTKSDIDHGECVAIVFDMLTRTTSDVIISAMTQGSNAPHRPTSGLYTGSWAQRSGVPNAIITFNDGTKGWIDGSQVFSADGVKTFNTGSANDEHCAVFTTPSARIKVDALYFYGSIGSSNADAALNIYKTPTGTPASLLSSAITVDANQGIATSARLWVATMLSPVNIAPSTQVAVCVVATTANNVTLGAQTLNAAGDRVSYPGGTGVTYGTRDGGSGAISLEDPAVTVPVIGLRFSLPRDCRDSVHGGTCFDN